MKTVHITEAFTGYPHGKDKRDFAKGEETEVSNEYAELLVGKGLAREVPAEITAKTQPAAPAPAKGKDQPS